MPPWGVKRSVAKACSALLHSRRDDDVAGPKCPPPKPEWGASRSTTLSATSQSVSSLAQPRRPSIDQKFSDMRLEAPNATSAVMSSCDPEQQVHATGSKHPAPIDGGVSPVGGGAGWRHAHHLVLMGESSERPLAPSCASESSRAIAVDGITSNTSSPRMSFAADSSRFGSSDGAQSSTFGGGSSSNSAYYSASSCGRSGGSSCSKRCQGGSGSSSEAANPSSTPPTTRYGRPLSTVCSDESPALSSLSATSSNLRSDGDCASLSDSEASSAVFEPIPVDHVSALADLLEAGVDVVSAIDDCMQRRDLSRALTGVRTIRFAARDHPDKREALGSCGAAQALLLLLASASASQQRRQQQQQQQHEEEEQQQLQQRKWSGSKISRQGMEGGASGGPRESSYNPASWHASASRQPAHETFPPRAPEQKPLCPEDEGRLRHVANAAAAVAESAAEEVVQQEALQALVNLLSQCNANKALIPRLLPNGDGVMILLTALETGSMEVRQLAAEAVFSISMLNCNKRLLAHAGAVEPLVALLAPSISLPLSPHTPLPPTPLASECRRVVCKALFNIALVHSTCDEMVEAGAVPYLVDMLTDPASGLAEKATMLLKVLSISQEGRSAILDEDSAMERLVEVLESGAPAGKESAVMALLEIARSSPANCQRVAMEAPLPALRRLVHTGTARARERAVELHRLLRS